MATHSSILVWRILWTEEPGRLQSMGSQRVGHNWATLTPSFPKGTSLSCVLMKTWACLWRQGPLITVHPHGQLFSLQTVLGLQWFSLQFFFFFLPFWCKSDRHSVETHFEFWVLILARAGATRYCTLLWLRVAVAAAPSQSRHHWGEQSHSRSVLKQPLCFPFSAQ